jgi:type IV fimbrial biogenesis protein FimT
MFARARNGFSLIELMVALAVLTIVSVMAYPSLRAVTDSNRLTSAANETMAVLQTARMEAIRRNRRAVACLSANPSAAVPACSANGAIGWIVFMDANRNGQYAAGERLLRVATLPSGIQLRGSSNFAGRASFRSDGLARDATGSLLNATVDICMPVSEPAQNVRHVSIGSGSRLSITKASTPKACNTPGNDPQT